MASRSRSLWKMQSRIKVVIVNQPSKSFRKAFASVSAIISWMD